MKNPKEYKKYSDFTHDRNAEYHSTYRESKKEHLRQYHKQWRDKNPEKQKAAYQRRKAKIKEDPVAWAKYLKKQREYRKNNPGVARKSKRKNELGIKNATSAQPSGNCESCGNYFEKLVCDHDHPTGIIRGWICRVCNTGIGHLGDTVEGVEKALKYMKKATKKVEREVRKEKKTTKKKTARKKGKNVNK